MSPDIPSFGFEESVELLSNILPARALQHVVGSMSGAVCDRLAAAGISDASIAKLLDDEGVPRYAIAREAVRNAGASVDTPGDVYAVVDPSLRGEKNPMIEHVRRIVQSILGG